MDLKKIAFYIMVVGAVIIFLTVSCSESDNDDQAASDKHYKSDGHGDHGSKHAANGYGMKGAHAVHWGYEGAGAPHLWGELKAEYELCKSGISQSPIDISAVTVTELSDIAFDYHPSPLTIVNNGHTIQVNYAPGSSMTVAGTQYDLLQFHFHAPSEHTVGGKAYDLVAHLVHKAQDGQLGVIGVVFAAGQANETIATLWDNMPQQSGQTVAAGAVTINAADLLPPDLTYFNYAGSLTTPPCSEGVNWMVLVTPLSVSEGQVAQFTELFPLSARPVQPLNGRTVSLSN